METLLGVPPVVAHADVDHHWHVELAHVLHLRFHHGTDLIDLAGRSAPDLVLIDAVMPVVDGVAAIVAMRAMPALRTTPIVAISASAMVADRERCLEAGADAFLAKPIDVSALLDEVRQLLDLEWRAAVV